MVGERSRHETDIVELPMERGEDKMNKLEGLKALNKCRIPAIKWQEFTGVEQIGEGDPDEEKLWTVRVALKKGADLDLPKAIGVTVSEAQVFAEKMIQKLAEFSQKRGLGDKASASGMVVYYPHFVAKKSGILKITADRVEIVAVKDDLWNLKDESKIMARATFTDTHSEYSNKREFLEKGEISQLLRCAKQVRHEYKAELMEGTEIILEWSFIPVPDPDKKRRDDQKLLFHGMRTNDKAVK